MKNIENRIKNISNLLKSADKNLRKANKLLDALIGEVSTSFDDVPGTLGIFDGTHMVAADGKRYEVNPNYAAKSLLVVGDNLKMVEEDGKNFFKHVSKVNRKKLEGILNKKEGNWYALTDAGSYQLLETAIEFRRGEVNDKVLVLVPENDLNASYAALEKLLKEEEKVETKKEGKEEEKEEKEKSKKETKKKITKEKTTKKTAAKKEAKKKTTKKEEKPKKKSILKRAATTKKDEKVDSLLDDDLR